MKTDASVSVSDEVRNGLVQNKLEAVNRDLPDKSRNKEDNNRKIMRDLDTSLPLDGIMCSEVVK